MSITTVSFSANTLIKSADVNTNFGNITAAIPWSSNPIAAKGDLPVGSASSTTTTLSVGTNGQVLTADSSQATGVKWSTPSTAPVEQGTMYNLGFKATVGSNNLTIALTQSDGASDPAASPSDVKVGFRNSTSSTGGFSTVSATSATSLVVPSGATLGHASGANEYIYLYALNNAGTLELAVVGRKLFDDGSIQSTTTISGSSTSGTTLYSTTGRSNVAVRLIGRIAVSEASAGVWVTGPTECTILYTKPARNETDWVAYTPTFVGFGTCNPITVYSRRVGDTLEVQGTFTTGITDASNAQFGLGYNGTAANVTIDTNKIGTSVSLCGTVITDQNNAQGGVYALIATGANTYLNWSFAGTSANGFSVLPGNSLTTNGKITFSAKVPIQNWWAYGP